MKTITIKGQPRTESGKKAATLLRRENKIPCVLYGGEENHHFSAVAGDFKKLIFSPDFYKVALELGDKTIEAIVKEVQFHPVKDTVEHVDFLELIPGAELTTELPVHVTGTAPGVIEGGQLKVKTRKLQVKLSPESLVEHIDVDVSGLTIGKSVKVADLDLSGIEIQNSPGIPIVSCEVPRAMKGMDLEEEAAAEAEAAEGAEGAEGADAEEKPAE